MAYKDRDKQRAYQRTWVRQKRANGSTKPVRPVEPDVEPNYGCMDMDTLAKIDSACGEPCKLPDSILTPEPQSYNPMMVGYVPPTE